MRPAAPSRCSIALAATTLLGAAALPATAAAPAPAAPARVAATNRPASAPAPVAASAAAGRLTDACPVQLPVNQTVSETIAGWTPLNQQESYPFVRVAFYPGRPTATTLIVPTVEYKGQSGLHDGWDLPRRADGYWMTCAYANTTATLTRQLAPDVDFCQADYDGRFITLVVRHWSCGVKRAMAPPAWARPKPVKPGSKAAGRRSG